MIKQRVKRFDRVGGENQCDKMGDNPFDELGMWLYLGWLEGHAQPHFVPQGATLLCLAGLIGLEMPEQKTKVSVYLICRLQRFGRETKKAEPTQRPAFSGWIHRILRVRQR
jgi:hypothetical protein